MGEKKHSSGDEENVSFTTGNSHQIVTINTGEWELLTRVGADGDRDDPEEERKGQCGTKYYHVGHHLGVFFHQHLTFRVHSGEL